MLKKMDAFYMTHESRRMDAGIRMKISVLSFVFSLAVLLAHSAAKLSFSNVINDHAVFYAIDQFFEPLCGISVSFFFLSSAFMFYYNLSFSTLPAKLKRRFHTLAIPFLLWNGIMYLVGRWYLTGTDRIYLNVIMSKYDGPLWFIGALLLLLACSPALLMVFRSRWGGGCALAVLYALALNNWFGVDASFPIGMNAGRFLSYVPIYCTGAYLGIHWFDAVNEERYGSALSVAAAALIFLLSWIVQVPVLTALLHTLHIILVWIFLPKRLFLRPLPWWQQIPFFTFATHEALLIKLKGLIESSNVIKDTVNITAGNALLWRFSLGAIVFGAVIICAWLLIRFAPRAYSTLTGGRLPNPLPGKRNNSEASAAR